MEKLSKYEIDAKLPPDFRASVISTIRLLDAHGCRDFTLQYCIVQRMQSAYYQGNMNGLREAQLTVVSTINKLGHAQTHVKQEGR